MAARDRLSISAATASAEAVGARSMGTTRPIGELRVRGLPGRCRWSSRWACCVWLLAGHLHRVDAGLAGARRRRASWARNLSSDPSKAGIAQGLFGSLDPDGHRGGPGPPDRHRGRRLPRGVRARQLAHARCSTRPCATSRASRRSSTGCSGLAVFVRRCWRAVTGGRNRHRGWPDARDRRAADRDHHRGRGAARRAGEHPRGRLRRGRHASGRSIRSHVLPYAAPGIFTGIILTLARAFGETAPLLLVGAAAAGFGHGGQRHDPRAPLGPVHGAADDRSTAGRASPSRSSRR